MSTERRIVSMASHRRENADKDARRLQTGPKELWVVLDETGRAIYTATWPEACHEHITDALQEHDITEARHWVVRRAIIMEHA